MENKIHIENAKETDIDQVVGLEQDIWPEGTRAPKEKFINRLKTFPQGFFLAFKNSRLIGVSTSEIIDYQPGKEISSWEEITDDGWIQKSHNPQGNAIYVVSIGSVSRSGGGSALVRAQKELTQKLNLDYLVLGARIPGYDKFCLEHGETDIDDYVKKLREDNQPLDPELRFYVRNGLKLMKTVPNYMEDDKESRNYGAIMVWENKDKQ